MLHGLEALRPLKSDEHGAVGDFIGVWHGPGDLSLQRIEERREALALSTPVVFLAEDTRRNVLVSQQVQDGQRLVRLETPPTRAERRVVRDNVGGNSEVRHHQQCPQGSAKRVTSRGGAGREARPSVSRHCLPTSCVSGEKRVRTPANPQLSHERPRELP
eukprot:scaffold1402_cov254-Pinguiococcus_pyrenoidosus.AAC.36